LNDDPGQEHYDPTRPLEPPEFAYDVPDPVKVPFIDRAHITVWNTVWRSSMITVFPASRSACQQASGSIAPALLWDKFDGLTPRLRFDADMPLPHLNARLHAFIGRVNRDEYVTERSPQSGAFAKQYGPLEDDETLFGIRYREPKQGGHFTADAALLRTPPDPS
jgi:hypothetical protein